MGASASALPNPERLRRIIFLRIHNDVRYTDMLVEEKIEAVAKERGMAVDGAFGGALASMRSGTLTPNQAAVLQEGMFELGKGMSRDLPPEYSQHAQSEGGLSPMEVSELS